ncbi:CHAP domain-containing protein [Zavarzinia sp.]|uniref:CHAP domain-containing protein n=1 Tax=Zavarzinia sp. TaxID=2027920 RepID=UPI003569BA12
MAFAIAASVSLTAPAKAVECVPYARQVSGVEIKGDAWTWWGQARQVGYQTGGHPKVGAVMVFKRANGMRRGHVAVVRNVVNSREVVIDHANWAGRRSGMKGRVDRGVSVIDVSPRNDWSMVRVWYPVIDDYGTSIYPLYGFIYNGGAPSFEDAVARSDDGDDAAADARGLDSRPANARVEEAGPIRVSAPAGTLDSQLRSSQSHGATVMIRAGKPVVIGHPVVSEGDPGSAVEPPRRPTERADEPRSPTAKPRALAASAERNPSRHVVPKPAAGKPEQFAANGAQLPAMPTIKPAP